MSSSSRKAGLLGCLRQPRLLRNQPLKSMRENLKPALQASASRTVQCFRDRFSRAAGRPRLRRGQARWCLACLPAGRFFARHLHSFTVTRNSQPLPVPIAPDSYRDGRQKTRHRDPSLLLWAGSDGT
jgi:hypothetical protein